MRLHRLCVTAFGPFAGTQEVDFDALGAGGLFLFTGATGAGKTSLLDAVCFALYGQVPGARQQARALRSDHAADGLPPTVVLEATLRGRRLRVTRSPAWERPKRRGAGTVTENAKVVLEEAGPDGWTTLSTRLDEAGQLLGGLTGLSLAQFCQVVLLPQGQFAEFLRADADRRRELLETLFDTRRFASVEAWLVARRQGAARSVDELDQRLGQVLARVGEAAGTEVPDGVSPDDAPGWVERLLAQARAAAGRAAADAAGAATRADEAASRLAAARRDGELRRRHTALEARLAGLGAQSPVRDAAVTELAAARAVAPLAPLLSDAARLQTELEQARARVAGARTLAVAAATAGLAATGTDSGGSLPPARAVGTAYQAARDEATGLRAVLEQEREIDELARSADSMARGAVQASAVAAKAAEWLAGAPERRAALATARDEAKAAAESAGALAVARDTAAARLAAGERRDALRDTVADAGDVLRASIDRHQRAVGRLQALRADRLAGMAAELAAGLAAGDDCPVCGSAEHPRPARAVTPRVTPAVEEAAEAEAAAAEQARRAATEGLARAELDLVAARTAAGGEVPAPELAAGLAAASAAAARAQALAAQLPAAESALAAFDREREQWTRDQVAQDAEAVHLAARVADQQARVTELLDVVGRARGDDPSVAARVERLGRLAADLQRLAEQLAELERLEVAVADALERAEAGVRSRQLAALDSLEAVSRAVRDDEQVAGLELLVHRHDAALAATREQLGDPELMAAAARPRTDVAAAESAASGAASARDRSLSHAAAVAARVVALERLQGVLDATLRERAPMARRHALVDGLSRLAEGKSADNRLRMSLSAYVLAARLEQVAASASARLLRMSSGRFSLLHSADGGSGRARGGLALRVLDAWTGRERDPATLSGGESFSASLALALGLADVVTSEAGGAVLETLFVDEGFGSLDDDTLDEVMGVLDDLRDGGRTVGLVSHVADLRQRIPVQLRVEKGRDGSVVRQ